MSGRISIEAEKAQFLLIKEDGSVESFRNPIDQVKRHVRFIEHLIARRLPVLYAIIFSHSRTIIGQVPQGEPIFKLRGLESFVRRMLAHYPEKLIFHELDAFALFLAGEHQARSFDIQVDNSRLSKGVICSGCGNTMTFYYGKFNCRSCGHVGLADYRYCVSEWITNQELRAFFHIDSEAAAKRLLVKLEFEYEGTFRNRRYKICLEKLKSPVNE